MCWPAALFGMTNHADSHPHQPTSEPIEQLAIALVGCGAVLSQMISAMVAAAHASEDGELPEMAPIPDTAHQLVRDALAEILQFHSPEELRLAAVITELATDAICENIFIVPAEELDRLVSD
jgi:hypothetical protein